MANGNPNIKQIKMDAHLDKQVRFSDGIMTMREKIHQMMEKGSCRLEFVSVGSYKKCGERFDNKPTWGFYRGDGSGFTVGKLVAQYIYQLEGWDLAQLEEIEKAGLDKWKRENKPTTPGLRAGYMGR